MCAMKEGSSNQVSNLISLPGISYCLHDINQIKKFFYKWGFPSPHNVKKRVTAHGCRKKDIIKRIFELKEYSFRVSSCCLPKPRHVTIIIMYCVLFFERIFRSKPHLTVPWATLLASHQSLQVVLTMAQKRFSSNIWFICMQIEELLKMPEIAPQRL